MKFCLLTKCSSRLNFITTLNLWIVLPWSGKRIPCNDLTISSKIRHFSCKILPMKEFVAKEDSFANMARYMQQLQWWQIFFDSLKNVQTENKGSTKIEFEQIRNGEQGHQLKWKFLKWLLYLFRFRFGQFSCEIKRRVVLLNTMLTSFPGATSWRYSDNLNYFRF